MNAKHKVQRKMGSLQTFNTLKVFGMIMALKVKETPKFGMYILSKFHGNPSNI